jgi:hypothetical protein
MGVGGQRRGPVALPPWEETRYPLYRRLGGPQGRSEKICYRHDEKILRINEYARVFDQVSAFCAGFTKFIFIDNNNTSNNNTNMAVELLGVSNLPVPHVIFFF